MIKENNNGVQRFSTITDDLKLQDIPRFNRYNNNVFKDMWFVIKILAIGVVLCLYEYYVFFNPDTIKRLSGYAINMSVKALAAVVGGVIAVLGLLYSDICTRRKNGASRKEIKERRNEYLESVCQQIISYRDDISEWMNTRFVSADDLIRRVMRGEKKICSQRDTSLTYRIGTGDQDISEHIILPEMLKITLQNIRLKESVRKIIEENKVIHDIPKVISLDDVGLLGVIGRDDKRMAYGIARALAAQILISEVPENLKVAFVYDSTHNRGWDRYVSFTRTQIGKDTDLVAGTPEKRRKLLDMLVRELCERKTLDGDRSEDVKPRYVVFVDDINLLEDYRIVEELQDKVDGCACTFVFVADRMEKLPENVEYTLVDSTDFSGVYSMSDGTCMPVVFDKLSEQKLDKYIKYVEQEKKKMNHGK